MKLYVNLCRIYRINYCNMINNNMRKSLRVYLSTRIWNYVQLCYIPQFQNLFVCYRLLNFDS